MTTIKYGQTTEIYIDSYILSFIFMHGAYKSNNDVFVFTSVGSKNNLFPDVKFFQLHCRIFGLKFHCCKNCKI